MKRLAILLLGLLMVFTVSAQRLTLEEVQADKYAATGNYLIRSVQSWPSATPAPKGYKPFYLSTYIRHGARLFSQDSMYSDALKVLRMAREQSMLTAAGEDFLSRYESLYPLVEGRGYDLTQIGADQHRELAAELYRRYPSIFKGARHIDARSTTLTRTIISLAAECETLKGLNPKLDIDMSASNVDMGALNPTSSFNPKAEVRDYSTSLEATNAPWQPDYRKLWEENADPDVFFGRLFKDWTFVTKVYPDAITAQKMFYYLISNTQSFSSEVSFMDFVTPEEMLAMWECENFRFYCICGKNEYFKGRNWSLSEALLRDIIKYAEADIQDPQMAARLRLGHDFKVSSLLTVLDVEGFNQTAADPRDVKNVYNYSCVPMATAIEFVFYKNRKGNVLVRVAHDGKDLTLPIEGAEGPYYEWIVFKEYCMSRIALCNDILYKTKSPIINEKY